LDKKHAFEGLTVYWPMLYPRSGCNTGKLKALLYEYLDLAVIQSYLDGTFKDVMWLPPARRL
jgi:hypothetical protein